MDQSTYNNGQLNATASPVPTANIQPGAGGGFGDMSEIFKRALEDQLRRKQVEQNQAAAAQRQQQLVGPGFGAAMHTPSQMQSLGNYGGREASYDPLRGQQEAMQADQMMIDRLPQNKYRESTPGIIGGYMGADAHTMNAATRQRYLAQNASEPTETKEQTAARERNTLIGGAGSTAPKGGY